MDAIDGDVARAVFHRESRPQARFGFVFDPDPGCANGDLGWSVDEDDLYVRLLAAAAVRTEVESGSLAGFFGSIRDFGCPFLGERGSLGRVGGSCCGVGGAPGLAPGRRGEYDRASGDNNRTKREPFANIHDSGGYTRRVWIGTCAYSTTRRGWARGAHVVHVAVH